MNNDKWSDREIKILKSELSQKSWEEILVLLPNRTRKSIQIKAFRLGIHRGHKLREYNCEPKKTIDQSFWQKVNKIPNGCWEWTGCILKDGYGQVGTRKNRGQRAHRVAYELLIGPIPDGAVLDHLCCNTKCVNPAHLEPVSNQENVIRGYLRKYEKSHAGTFKTIETSVAR